MDKVYKDITLDFDDNDSMVNVRVKQNDDGGRVVRVSCLNSGVPFDVTNSFPALFASTNGIVTAMGTLLAINSDGQVLVPITAALSAIAGVSHCEIKFYTDFGSGIVYSARFNLLVGAASATNDMPEVVPMADLITDVEEANKRAGEYIKNLIELEHFKNTRIRYYVPISGEQSSLLSNPPKYNIPDTDYSPSNDWLFMFKNETEFISKDAYTIDTETIEGAVRIIFDPTKCKFKLGDTFEALIFKPGTSGSGAAGVTVGVLSGTDSGSNAGETTNLDSQGE